MPHTADEHTEQQSSLPRHKLCWLNKHRPRSRRKPKQGLSKQIPRFYFLVKAILPWLACNDIRVNCPRNGSRGCHVVTMATESMHLTGHVGQG